jgi:hypothetical protein
LPYKFYGTESATFSRNYYSRNEEHITNHKKAKKSAEVADSCFGLWLQACCGPSLSLHNSPKKHLFMTISSLPTPIKGKADWREYKAFQLENGVIVLTIHDKESKTTSMSCSVNVGAAADPRSLSGLAHFCEHMW